MRIDGAEHLETLQGSRKMFMEMHEPEDHNLVGFMRQRVLNMYGLATNKKTFEPMPFIGGRVLDDLTDYYDLSNTPAEGFALSVLPTHFDRAYTDVMDILAGQYKILKTPKNLADYAEKQGKHFGKRRAIVESESELAAQYAATARKMSSNTNTR